MKISVITVAFNSGRTIRHTIESFVAQSHRDAELLVMDGGSTDDTLAIVQSFDDPRIRLRSERDRGIYDAMNKGLRAFTGDAVGFLNSDDRFHDADALARVAEALETHEVAFGDLDFVTDHDSRRVVRRWRGTPYRPGSFRSGWMPAHPTFYVSRPVAERTGLFDTDLRLAADYDFMLRAMETGPVRAVHVRAVLIDMMVGGASTVSIRAFYRHNVEALRARRRVHGFRYIDYAFFAKPLRKVSQWGARHRP